jgi:hypothetical protein
LDSSRFVSDTMSSTVPERELTSPSYRVVAWRVRS